MVIMMTMMIMTHLQQIMKMSMMLEEVDIKIKIYFNKNNKSENSQFINFKLKFLFKYFIQNLL